MNDLPKFKDWYEETYHFKFPGHPGEMTEHVQLRMLEAMAAWCDLIADAALERATGYAVGDPENRDE